ncbi:MAG: hypothetical protein ABSC94_11965 [Polyangiaceae bacterium]|jgi:hypothetical protein
MPVKTPLTLVKEKFGDKDKLVEALEKLAGEGLWLSRTNEHKGLRHVSNAKLLRLHATFAEVTQKFGSREKLIDALLVLEKRTGDPGFRQKLSAWPVPRLFDAYRSAAKREAAQRHAAERREHKTSGAARGPMTAPSGAKKSR